MAAAAITLVVATLALSGIMALAWRVAMGTGRSGWIDSIWSLAVGFGGVAAALAPLGGLETIQPRQWLVAAFALAWSLRLGGHIAARTASGEDDPRYAHLRTQWGAAFRGRLFWFLQIQALAALLLAATIAIAAHRPGPMPTAGDLLGIAIILVAVAGEGLADRQLARFRADPANRGKVCDTGLWGRSRHPNYFFEWLVWVAFAVVALAPAGGYAPGWAALAGPAFMYWLLVRVSGIPPLEAHMIRSRGDRYRAYQARVNAFWPGPDNKRKRS